jgi:hypothetical protein
MQLQRSMRPPRVVAHGISGKHLVEEPFAEDQHTVGELGSDRQYEAFGEAVRPRATGWDLDDLDAHIGQNRVERGRKLSGAIADEELEPRDVFAEVHHEVAGLLGGPGPVGVRGDAQDVEEAVADLEREQDVDPSQGHRAVDVEEVDGEHAGGLGAQELPPAGVGVPNRGRWDPVALEDPADRRGAAVAELEYRPGTSCIPSSGSQSPQYSQGIATVP